MTKQKQLAALVCASETLDGYVSSLAYDGVITENEAKDFDRILKSIDEVAEEIRHEATPSTHIYIVWEDDYGITGYHKTFEGAKKQLMKNKECQELADNYPLDYDGETRWGWEFFNVERIEVEE